MKFRLECDRQAVSRRKGGASVIVPKERAPTGPAFWSGMGKEGICSPGRTVGLLQEVIVFADMPAGQVLVGETGALLPPGLVPSLLKQHPTWAALPPTAALPTYVGGFMRGDAVNWMHGPIPEISMPAQQVWFIKAQSTHDAGTFLRLWITIRYDDPVIQVHAAIVYSNQHDAAYTKGWAPSIVWADNIAVRFLRKPEPDKPLHFGCPVLYWALLQVKVNDTVVPDGISHLWGMPDASECTAWAPGLRITDESQWPPTLEPGWNVNLSAADNPLLRQIESPPGTGDRWCFGSARGYVGLGMSPASIEALLVGCYQEARRMYCVLEPDGLELKAENHPMLTTQGTAPDHRGYTPSPDVFGKPLQTWPVLDGMAPQDTGHLAMEPHVGAFQLTFDPFIGWMLRSAGEMLLKHLDAGPADWGPMGRSYGNPRAIGRQLHTMAALAQLFPERKPAYAEKVKKALTIITDQIKHMPGVVRTLQVVTEAQDGRVVNPVNEVLLQKRMQGQATDAEWEARYKKAYMPWQDGLAIFGIAAAWRVMPEVFDQLIKDTLPLYIETYILDGYWRNPQGAWLPNWTVAYDDSGVPVIRDRYADETVHGAGAQHLLFPGGGTDLALVTDAPGVWFARLNPWGNFSADVVARADEMWGQLPRNNAKDYGWHMVLPDIRAPQPDADRVR